jgi:hypothetical protein
MPVCHMQPSDPHHHSPLHRNLSVRLGTRSSEYFCVLLLFIPSSCLPQSSSPSFQAETLFASLSVNDPDLAPVVVEIALARNTPSDNVRALELLTRYLAYHEPTQPTPLLLQQCKLLGSMVSLVCLFFLRILIERSYYSNERVSSDSVFSHLHFISPHQGFHDHALEVARAAHRSAPDNIDTWTALCRAHMDLSQYHLALAAINAIPLPLLCIPSKPAVRASHGVLTDFITPKSMVTLFDWL